ncbi:MAG: restriction endonuclease subunit S, partial [bacterium]
RLDLSEVAHVDLPAKVEGKRSRIQPGDLLVTITGANVGKAAIVPDNIPEAYVSQSVGLMRLKDKKNGPYLHYYLQSEQTGRKQVLNLVYGIGRPVLSLQSLRDIPVSLPPLPEQHRIVAEIEKQFTRLEAGVSALKRVQANLKRYRAAVLKAACEGRLVPTEAELAGRDRRARRSYESGSELLTRILADRSKNWTGRGQYKEPAAPITANLGPLPEGWTWATAQQLNLANRPCAYGVLQPGEDVQDGVPFVRVGDINNGKVDLANMKRISTTIAAQYPRTKLHGGELVITLVGAIGRTAIIPESLAGGNTARAVGIIPLTNQVNAHWVEIWFRNPAKNAEMDSKSHEVARKTLNLEDVRVASVALPPLAEQTRIVAEVERRLSVVEELEATVSANLQRATRLRQAVLQKAFTGELA